MKEIKAKKIYQVDFVENNIDKIIFLTGRDILDSLREVEEFRSAYNNNNYVHSDFSEAIRRLIPISSNFGFDIKEC